MGLQEITKSILDVLFPPRPYCIVCSGKLKTGERFLCGECEKKMVAIKPPLCKKCGRPFWGHYEESGPFASQFLCGDCRSQRHYYVEARSYGHYEGVLKHLIHEFKYRGRRDLSKYLGGRMVSTLKTLGWPEFDCAVPVPLHIKRERERGYNQAALLADVLGREANLPVCRALVRVKPTEHQTFLDKACREKNLTGAFAAAGGVNLKGKTVLLIDDVYTTGSTADECSRSLLNAGAAKVFVLTCARG